MVKQNSVKRRRGRPKGSKNKRKVLPAHVPNDDIIEAVAESSRRDNRYILRSRVETDAMDAFIKYYFIYDLNRGAIYPEIIARFTVETEANLCVEFLNGIRKISEKEYNKKRIHIPQE
jgi:hypothetical protein